MCSESIRERAAKVARWPNTGHQVQQQEPAPQCQVEPVTGRALAEMIAGVLGALGCELAVKKIEMFFAKLLARHATAGEGLIGLPRR
jgi:hypothetical protein